MIQVGTFLNVIDNSGAKEACCIKIVKGYKKRYAFVGDLLFVSVKSLRSKRKSSSKVKKGDVKKAVIVRTVYPVRREDGSYINFDTNSVVIIAANNEPVGTRIFGPVARELRNKNFSKICSLAHEVL